MGRRVACELSETVRTRKSRWALLPAAVAGYSLLLEKLLDLVFPGLALRAVLGAALGHRAFELAQHVLLALGQAHRGFHHDVAEQVAGQTGAHSLDALAAQ